MARLLREAADPGADDDLMLGNIGRVIEELERPEGIKEIAVHGRNGTFCLHDINVAGSKTSVFVDLLAKGSNLKNPPSWWQGTKDDLLAVLREITTRLEAIPT